MQHCSIPKGGRADIVLDAGLGMPPSTGVVAPRCVVGTSTHPTPQHLRLLDWGRVMHMADIA